MSAFRAERFRRTFDDADLLDQIAHHLKLDGTALIDTAGTETGLSPARLSGELQRTVSQLRAFAGAVREHAYGEPMLDLQRTDEPTRTDMRRINVPIGPVAVWPASNFPLAFGVAGGDTTSALAAGCPVVVKAHPSHPLTSELTADLIADAIAACGAPVQWFSMVQSDSVEISLALAQHRDVRAIAFTGSLQAGRALFDAGSARPDPVPVYAEMGSLNPVVVLPAAARSDASLPTGLATSITGSAGQLCTKPGLILVLDGAETDAFVEELAFHVRQTAPQRMLSEALRDRFRSQVADTLSTTSAVAVAEAAETVDQFSDLQAPMLASVESAALHTEPKVLEEHFGPFAMVVRCHDAADLLESIAALPSSLTATVRAVAEDEAVVSRLLPILTEKSGRIIFNGFPTGVQIGWATVHGGPYPATTAPATTSVGLTAARRFLRPVAFQNAPEWALPPALTDANPGHAARLVNGAPERVDPPSSSSATRTPMD